MPTPIINIINLCRRWCDNLASGCVIYSIIERIIICIINQRSFQFIRTLCHPSNCPTLELNVLEIIRTVVAPFIYHAIDNALATSDNFADFVGRKELVIVGLCSTGRIKCVGKKQSLAIGPAVEVTSVVRWVTTESSVIVLNLEASIIGPRKTLHVIVETIPKLPCLEL